MLNSDQRKSIMSVSLIENKRNKDSKESRKKSHASSVSEKVKEIKQRQDNWMKQRATHKGEESPVSMAVPKSSCRNEDFPVDKVDSDRPTKQDSTDVKSKFKNWLENRENVKNQNNANSYTDDQEEEFDRLVVDSDCSKSESESDFQLLQERLLSTKDFDAKADSIVNKVRRDLNLSSNSSRKSIDRSQSCIENRDASKRHDENSYLSSHLCPVCTISMISSHNTPMLLIPCGHTVCQQCSEQNQTCSVCDCTITSVTCNIMLQQIIQEYGVSKKQNALPQTRHQSAKTTEEYSSNRYQTKTKPKKVSEYKKYQEQLDNFETRIEILQTEKMSVSDEIKDIDTQIGVEHRQLQNIERQRTEIENEICHLQDKLQTLGQHEEEYHEKCANLEHVKVELKTKMGMLDNTVASLNQEVEKIEFLMESEEN